MKVLILPLNIASEISHKVKALREIGIDARGLAFNTSAIQEADGIKIIASQQKDFSRIFRSVYYLYKWIKWADVIHWIGKFDAVNFSFGGTNFTINEIDKKILKLFDKPGVIEWLGSEVRNPELDCKLNSFYKRAFENGYEYADYESAETSLSNQRDFHEVGFYPFEYVGMEHYVDRRLFPKRFPIWQAISVSEHEPKFPDPNKKKPLVIHSPSAPVAKGTKYVLEAVEKLKREYDFEFKLVQNMKRREALKIMREADIFVDQLIIGAHGVSAVEAMAFGKPVLCYINNEIGKNYPAELPIVNANPENVGEKIEMLLKNPLMRNEIGKKSREYVEKYHDERKIAADLVETYRQVIELHKQKKSDG